MIFRLSIDDVIQSDDETMIFGSQKWEKIGSHCVGATLRELGLTLAIVRRKTIDITDDTKLERK